MISPFWADIDTRCGDGLCWQPIRWVVAVTRDNVGYDENHDNKTNSFQAVLIDRSDKGTGNFNVEFRYDHLDWTTGDASDGSGDFGGAPAQAGDDAGDGKNYFALPSSFSAEIGNLAATNTDEDRVWRFAIREGALPGATPENPIMPVVVDGGWSFDFNVGVNEPIFIAPDVAVDHDYIVDQGPNMMQRSGLLKSLARPEIFDFSAVI